MYLKRNWHSNIRSGMQVRLGGLLFVVLLGGPSWFVS